MKQADQETSYDRYTTIPRTLVFVHHQDLLLLLRGAPHKRLWANKLNGVGGHIEADEDPWRAAQREVLEEAGLRVSDLRLVAVVHISGSITGRGVMLFVFLAQAASMEVRPCPEGELAWYPLDALPWTDMVDDLPLLLPRILATMNVAAEVPSQIIYGLYTPGMDGQLTFAFHCSS